MREESTKPRFRGERRRPWCRDRDPPGIVKDGRFKFVPEVVAAAIIRLEDDPFLRGQQLGAARKRFLRRGPGTAVDIEDEGVLAAGGEIGRIGDDAVHVETVVIPFHRFGAAEFEGCGCLIEIGDALGLGGGGRQVVQFGGMLGLGSGEGQFAGWTHRSVEPEGRGGDDLAEVDAARLAVNG